MRKRRSSPGRLSWKSWSAARGGSFRGEALDARGDDGVIAEAMQGTPRTTIVTTSAARSPLYNCTRPLVHAHVSCKGDASRLFPLPQVWTYDRSKRHAGESARAAAMVRHDDTIKYYYVDGNATQAGPVFLPELQTMCDRELHPNPTLAPHQN